MDAEYRHCRLSGIRTVVRGTALLVWWAALLTPDIGRGAVLPAHGDPLFDKLHFDYWQTEGERNDITWSADILPAEISPHQRLMLRVVIRLYGSELEKRRGAGEFVTLVQYTDSAGRIWQHHTSLDLEKLPAGTGNKQLAIAQYAYVLPGDYSLAIAVCDTATLEHGLINRQVHAAPLRDDPLPEAWKNLPAVDFIPPITEPPDVWYLPGVEGRLNLPVVTRRPVDIHLLVNITPSRSEEGSIAAMQRNMGAVIPLMKVFSQMQVRNGSMEIALLDLTNHRVAFDQKNASRLDWDGMRKVLLHEQPGIVDAHALESRSTMRAFFRDEIVQRLHAGARRPDAPIPVVIVLSGTAFLDGQEPEVPVQPPDRHDYRVFYIRWHGLPAPAADDLEHAVEPFNASIYEAASKERVREIVASVIGEISKL